MGDEMVAEAQMDYVAGVTCKDEEFAVRVVGAGMEPELLPGDLVVASHHVRPRRGDLVVSVDRGTRVVRVERLDGARHRARLRLGTVVELRRVSA